PSSSPPPPSSSPPPPSSPSPPSLRPRPPVAVVRPYRYGGRIHMRRARRPHWPRHTPRRRLQLQ
ncbi:unnamed protein product, partial [Rotaria sordida]